MDDALADVVHRPADADDWNAYVSNQFDAYIADEIHPGFDRSWLLRKAVRAGLPLQDIARLVTGELRADPTANDAEALRYAIVDGKDAIVDLLIAMVPRDYNVSRLILWAALAQNAHARDHLDNFAADALYVGEVDAVLGRGAPVPRAPVVDWMAEWTLLAAADDRDNYQALDGFRVISAPSHVEPRTEMGAWLPDADPNGDDFVDHLGELLANSYGNFRVLGSGTYGMVLAATRTDTRSRVALKFVTIADPLGELSPVRRQLARAELRINLALARWAGGATFPAFPRLVQWTRGRFNLHKTLVNLRGRGATSSDSGDAGPIRPGTGIYLVMEIPLMEFTLQEWMRAVVRVANGRSGELRKYALILEAFIVALIVQLVDIRRALPGFRHSDIKANNVLMQRVRRTDTVADAVVGERRFMVRGANTTGYAVSLSDFGLASYDTPTGRLGAKGLRDDDFANIVAMPPGELASPQVVQWQSNVDAFANDPGAALADIPADAYRP